MISYLVVFACGAVSGAAALLAVGLILNGKTQDKARADALARLEAIKVEAQAAMEKYQQNAAAKPPVAPDTVQTRLRKAINITKEQMKIDTRTGAPDNNLVIHNELELEKYNILKTILADGFDPPITIRYNTGEQEMALSVYLASIQKGLH